MPLQFGSGRRVQFIQTFNFLSLMDTAVSLIAAFVFGTLIGAERQYRQRSAGLRTNVLVAVGAAAFVDLGMRLTGGEGAVRIIAYVVSGIGFLGAGVIMKEGMNVRGLNTAATLWSTAAVGACAGADRIAEAGLVTVFILSGNTLLRPLVNAINRIPLEEGGTEAVYQVRAVVLDNEVPDVRAEIVSRLKAAKYPVGHVELDDASEDTTEIIATLVSTTAKPREMEAVVSQVRGLPGVRHVAWSANTSY